MSLCVKEDKMMEFIAAYAEARASGEHWVSYYDDLAVGEDRELLLGEYCRKWYEEERLYDFLKGFVGQGEIVGWGDDIGDYWRICFDGQGGWKKQVPIFVDKDSELAREYGD